LKQLEVSDLACVRGDRRLFSNLSFRLQEGGLLFLAGANGAGKTSLIRLLCALSPPEHGQIRWNGIPIDKQPQAFRRDLCYLGHQNSMQEALTVRENLRFLSNLAGHDPSDADIIAALAQMGLKGLSMRFVRHLSQGQKRRVALARLLLTPAKLWVLDEPFVALDTASVASLAQHLGRHLSQGGLAIYTSHQRVDIPAASSQVVELAV
jgi:heme exporter protein A